MFFETRTIFVTGLLLASCPLFAQRSAPNIILIVADDLGYGELGCYGQQKIHTPYLDAMARDGIRFTHFYAGTSVCAPSRASLMTGLHTGHTPVRGNFEIQPEGQYPLPDSTVTIAKLLEAQGYETEAFGKWGLGFPGSTGEPLKQGFDHFFGYNCQREAHSYYPDHLWQDERRIELPGNRVGDSVYSADLIHRHALAFLREQHQKPFFLFLPYTLPHAALYGPHDSLYDRYVREFGEQGMGGEGTGGDRSAGAGQQNGGNGKQAPPGGGRQAPGLNTGGGYRPDPHPHAAFAAMVSRLDQYVGEVLRIVREQGLADNTIILFTSDNGPHQEGGADPAYFQSGGPLRGVKRDLYEGGIRVPLIAVWQGTIRPGTTTAAPAAFWDLFPTFREIAGTGPGNTVSGRPKQDGQEAGRSAQRSDPAESRQQQLKQGPIDGLSILPLLKEQASKLPGEAKKAFRQHPYFYWEFQENGGRQAVLMGKWKGVRLNVSKLDDPPVELYDLDKDPGERKDLAAEAPAVAARIRQIMQEAHRYDPHWPLLKKEIPAPAAVR